MARAGLAAAAVAAIIWLAVGLQASRQESRAVELASPRDGQPPSAARIDEARRLLRDAGRKTAGTAAQILEAQLEAFADRPESAVVILQGVVRDEPKNYEAWLLLARTARSVDPVLAARARARLAVLSPPVPAGP